MRLPLRDDEKELLKTAIEEANKRRNQPTQRGDLVDWFDRIAEESERKEVNRKAVIRELNEALKEKDIVKLVPQLRVVKGRLRVEYEPDRNIYDGRSWAALATALILDERFGLADRLKRCGNPDCEKFNLDLKPHGRPRRNCNKTCQIEAEKAASRERSEEWRKQKKRR